MDYSGTEATSLKEFEIPSMGGSEGRLSAAYDYRVENQVTFVDEIGVERKPGQLGTADADVVLRLSLELPNSLELEVPFDTRVACGSARQRS